MPSNNYATTISLLEHHASKIIARKEKQIITELVNNYRNNKDCDHAQLLAKIAVISELRKLAADFQREMLDGTEISMED